MKEFIIYVLKDPTTKEIRYVGQSVNGLLRAKKHSQESDLKRHGKAHKTDWIRSLLKRGLKPEAEILEKLASPQNLYEREQYWIAKLKKEGIRLVNHTDGGPGRYGYKLSEESKIKIRKARAKQKPSLWSVESKNKMKNFRTGFKHKIEDRLNMSKAHKSKIIIHLGTGKKFSYCTQVAKELNIPYTQAKRLVKEGILFRLESVASKC